MVLRRRETEVIELEGAVGVLQEPSAPYEQKTSLKSGAAEAGLILVLPGD